MRSGNFVRVVRVTIPQRTSVLSCQCRAFKKDVSGIRSQCITHVVIIDNEFFIFLFSFSGNGMCLLAKYPFLHARFFNCQGGIRGPGLSQFSLQHVNILNIFIFSPGFCSLNFQYIYRYLRARKTRDRGNFSIFCDKRGKATSLPLCDFSF